MAVQSWAFSSIGQAPQAWGQLRSGLWSEALTAQVRGGVDAAEGVRVGLAVLLADLALETSLRKGSSSLSTWGWLGGGSNRSDEEVIVNTVDCRGGTERDTDRVYHQPWFSSEGMLTISFTVEIKVLSVSNIPCHLTERSRALRVKHAGRVELLQWTDVDLKIDLVGKEDSVDPDTSWRGTRSRVVGVCSVEVMAIVGYIIAWICLEAGESN